MINGPVMPSWEDSILRKDLAKSMANVFNVGKDYLETRSFINLTGLELGIKDRFGNIFNLPTQDKDPYTSNILSHYNNKVKDTPSFPAGVYLIIQYSVSTPVNNRLELYYRNNTQKEEYFPVPLSTTIEGNNYGGDMQKVAAARIQLDAINELGVDGRYTSLSTAANSVIMNHVRNIVFFIPNEALLQGYAIYDPKTDYIYSLYSNLEYVEHPFKADKSSGYLRTEIVNSENNETSTESFYYCPVSINTAPSLYKRSGNDVARIYPKERDNTHAPGYFYVSYQCYDSNTGENVTKTDSKRLMDYGLPISERKKYKEELERWLNSYGVYYTEKEALASIAETAKVERTLFEKEQLQRDMHIAELRHRQDINKAKHDEDKIAYLEKKLGLEDKKLEVDSKKIEVEDSKVEVAKEQVKVDHQQINADLQQLLLQLQKTQLEQDKVHLERKNFAYSIKMQSSNRELEKEKLYTERMKTRERLEDIQERREERKVRKSHGFLDSIGSLFKSTAAVITGVVGLVTACVGAFAYWRSTTA